MPQRLRAGPGWCVIALAACRPAPPQAISRTVIDSLNVAIDSAFRAGSVKDAAALFAPDANLSLVGVEDIHGREEFRKVLTSVFAANVVREHRFTAVEIETYDSVVYERGTFTWSAGPRGEVAKVDHGRYSIVRRRAPNGEWLIHRLLENMSPSPLQASGH